MPAKKSTPEATLREIENKWEASIAAHDPSVVQAYVANDYRGVSSKGKVINKSALLAQIKNDTDTYTSAKNGRMDVRVFDGRFAVIVGTVHGSGKRERWQSLQAQIPMDRRLGGTQRQMAMRGFPSDGASEHNLASVAPGPLSQRLNLMDPTSPLNTQPPRPGWWTRNWKWFVPTGCLGMLLLGGGVWLCHHYHGLRRYEVIRRLQDRPWPGQRLIPGW